MNRREGRGFVRYLLPVAALAFAFLLFAKAAVDRAASTPAPSPSPAALREVDSGPVLPAPDPEVAVQDDRGGKPPPLPPRKDEGGTSELLIFLRPGTNPAAYAQEHGLVHLHTLRSDPDAHVFGGPDAPAARAHLGRSKSDVRVRRSYPNERLQRVKCVWVPNDPYYPNGSPAGFPGQWHLGNGAIPGIDIHVPAAWNRDITGSGVIIGIVDDGLEIAHPDLAPNYVAADSWDFGQNDGNPSPVNGGANEDRHGTSVAGVAAARGGNGIGGTGAAPLAGLAGNRIDFVNQTVQMFVDGTLYHANAVNSNIKVKNHSYGYSATYIDSQAERDAVASSALVGTIHLYAAGNERGTVAQDSNKQHLQNSPDVIAVAAFGSNGKFASYSSFGANVFVTTPSSTSGGNGITTTDRVGNNGYNRNVGSGDGDTFPDLNYTSTFGGTSSATPLAAGVMALVKQVQPNLDVRFAKHLLARFSQIVDPNDNTATGGGDGATAGSAWKTNAAGLKFNQNYGFGLIDADALTQQALLYTGVTALQTATVSTTSVATTIPDNNLTGISRTFSFVSPPGTPLEEMLITLDITHPFRGDVEVYLTSPSGTQSRLAYRSGSDNGANIDWTFVSNAFWGETAAGTWTIQVRDVFAADVGTWNSFSATALLGQLIANTTPPAVSSIVRAGSNPTNASSVNYTVTFTKSVTGVNAADFTLASTGTIAGASVTGVSGSGSIFTVTVNTGSGDGTLRLDLVDDDSIQDGVGNKLGGIGAGNGNFNTGQFYTLDRSSPALLKVRSTTLDGFYSIGAPINVTLDFSEPVTLSGGNLQVTLSTGDVVTILPFGPASTISGTYTVGAGDNSADLNSISPLALTAGTLRDAAGNACALTIPAGQSLADLQALVIDTTAPQLVHVISSTPNGIYGPGAPINITVDFTESVTLAGGNLQVTLSTGDVVTIAPFGPSTSAAGTYTVGAGDTSADLNSTSPLALSGGTLRDAAGNNCVLTIPAGQRLADLKDLVIDTTGPGVTINKAAGQTDPSNTSPILFTVVFSEPVSGFATGDVTLSGTAGATTAIVSGASPTYTVTVTGMTGSGTVIASIGAGAAMDLAGNASAASTSTDNVVLYDITLPTVTINQTGGQADPTNASPILFTVVFSETVSGFGNGDVTLGGTAGATTAIVSGAGPTYTVTVSGMTSDGSVTASIAAGVALDAAGNGNLASTSGDNTVTFDATSPSVTINQAAGQSDPANVGPVLFTVVFSEAVTGFDATDVSLAGSTVGGTLVKNVTGGGTTYTVSVTGMTGTGTVVATIPAGTAIDAVGNLSSASTSTDNVVTFNTIVPTVTINQAAGQADPTNVSPVLFTVVFSEPMNGFATGDVTLSGTAGGTLLGTVSGASPGTTFTVTVTGMTSSGTIVASIPAGVATSAATTTPNAASASTDNTVTYDITAPTVTINQAAGQLDPSNGSPILFTVVFSEAVTGFATGAVTLSGTAGATTATVTGSGTTYTVSVSGMTSNGTVIASVAAGVAQDAALNFNVASTSIDNSVTRDVTAPTVTIDQAAGQLDPSNGSPILFTVVFSEAVTGFATGDVTLTGTAGATTATVTGSGTTYTVSVSGMTSNGTVIASVAAGVAQDAALNFNVASTSTDNSVTRDVTAPTVMIDQAAGQLDPSNGSPILFTVVFSEVVTGFATGDVTLSGTAGATTATVTGSGTTYTVSVSGMTSNGTVIASVPAGAAQDAALNFNVASTSADNTVTFDNTAPTVTINQTIGQLDPTNGSSILFTVVFSESVVGFATGDVTLGGTAGATTAAVSGGPTTYQVTVTGMSGDGTVTASLAAGVAADSAGNASLASTSGDNTVTVDLTSPSVTIDQAAGQVDPTNASPILFTVVFSEAVTGFTSSDVVVGGSAGGVAVVTGGPAIYTVSVSGMAGDGKVVLTIPAGAANDSGGNPNSASTSTDNAVTYDTTAPTVTIDQAAGQVDPSNASPILFTVVFSEAVTGFATGDVTLSGTAGATTATVTGSGTTYTVSVSGMTSNGTVIASVAAGVAQDAALNFNVASTSVDHTVTRDVTAPTVMIDQAAGQLDPTNGSPILFTVVFSEAVTGFATGDVTLSGTAGATTATVTGSGTTYTVAVSGMTSNGTVIASVSAGVAQDAALNFNVASTSTDNSVTRDVTAPTVAITQAAGQADPTNASPILFTVVFSEAVTGFTGSDVILSGTAGATTAIVSGAGPTYTVSVSGMTGPGSVIAAIGAGAANDLAGNASAASTSTDNAVAYDNAQPTVTINQAATQADPVSGGPILFTVVFSEAVTGFTSADVVLGGTAGGIAAVSGGPSTYTVSVTGMTQSGTVIASIGAGAAADGSANGNLASTSTDNTVTFDITPPTVTITQAAAQADPTNTSPIVFTALFSEPVTGFSTGGVTLGGTAGAATAIVSGSGTTYTVTVSGMTQSGTVTASVAPGVAADLAGNTNVASTGGDNTVTYDITPPTVTINQAVGQADPTNGSPILFTVVFSEAVTGFATGDVTLSGTAGATTATVTGSGTTYTVSVSGMTSNGTVIASVAAGVAQDAALNFNVASTSGDNSVTRDVTAPTVMIDQAGGQVDPTKTSPILFTVVFSEPVTGFATGAVTLSGTAGATTAIVSGAGPTYTVTVTGMTGSGTVIASIGAGVAMDLAGNASAASTSTDNAVVYDNAPPSVTINRAAAQADPTNTSPILFTVVFSEAVTGFVTGDVTLGGTAGATTAAVSGGPTTYQVSVTGMTGDGTVTASLTAGVASDAAGNLSLASTSSNNTVTSDVTAPTVTINQAAAQPDPTSSSPILFTVVFSEAVTGFTSGDVVVGGTAGGVASVSGGPTTYTVSVSGLSGDGTVTVTIPAAAALDASGNGNLAATSTDNSVTFDSSDPVVTQVTSTTPNGTYGSGASIVITVGFSEPVVVTGIPHLTLETGATDAVVNYTSGSGTTTLLFSYTVAAGHVSADLDTASAAALTLNGGTIRDPAGNDALLALPAPGSPGSLGANKNLVVDTTPPVAGTVNDGWAPPDVDTQLSVTTLSANWSGFSDPQSGITGYEWALGTTAGGQQLLPFTPVGLQTSASTSAVDLVLALANGSTCYVTVRATNAAGLTVTATSDGVTVSGTAAAGPAAPAGLWAVADDQAVILEWLSGPAVSFYRVWWKPAASSWTEAIRVDPLPGPSATISGLTNGVAYDFMIKAVDALENESPGVFVTATPLPSITIGGLGNFGTVQAAIDAAVPGETVMLGPGTYSETLLLHPGVSLSGSSPLHTLLSGTPGSPVITVQGAFPADQTSTIGNLTITSGTLGVDAGTADVLLHHVIIHHVTSHGAASAAGSRLRAVNCTILSNGGDGIRALGTAEVRSCIVGKNLGAGLNVPAGAQVNYDNVYGNGTSDYPAGTGGTGNLTVPAVFLDELANKFIEDSSSASVDSGDPLDAFSKELTPNGSRINQGAFGNTRWAATKGTPPASVATAGRKRGGGCGLTGLEALILLAFLRRRNSR